MAMSSHRSVARGIGRTAVVAIVLAAGCAARSPMDRQLAEMRRQVEMGCMKDLMDFGMPLMEYAEAMTTHCRSVANRVVRR